MEQKKKINTKISKSLLYNKFLGFLTKKGKKTVAKFLLEKVFLLLEKKIKLCKHRIFLTIFLKLNTFVETKKIKIRNRSYIVPFSLSLKRRSYLVIKWLLKVVAENKEKISIAEKIFKEIFEVFTNPKAKSLNYKKINNTQAFLNRSNFHYRW